MTEEHLNFKIKEYTDRSRFWTEKTITQLGYSINLMTTIGIGIFGYLISNRDKLIKKTFVCQEVDCMIQVFFYISLILIFLSIIFGIFSILSRLYDFRITRNLSLFRKRYLLLKKNDTGLINSTFDENKRPKYLICFFRNIFGTIDFISEDNLKDDKKLKIKFVHLQFQSFVLGAFTWKAHKLQVFFIALSLVFLFLSIVTS